jgi:hypothetical protein
MTKNLLFVLFVFFGFVANAQIPKQDVAADLNIFPKEKVALSINSNVLLAGELLQYEAFNLDVASRESKLSKVLYVSLRNQSDSVVFTHKLKVEKGVANGDFFIPSALKTGTYRLIGYTNFSRNSVQDAYTQKNIYIINTFVKPVETKKISDTVKVNFSENEIKLSEKANNNEKGQITISKQSYGFREKVTLNIQNTLEKIGGNYVLSVRKVNPVVISDAETKGLKDVSSEIFYVPELRGELISGVVRSTIDGKPVVNKQVSLTIPGKDFVFKIAKTNDNGRFFFSVSEGYNTEKSLVQLYTSESDAANYSLVLDKKDFDLGKSDATVLKLDSNLKEWLLERSVQLQIENAYFDAKKDSILSNPMNPAFYDHLGTEFVLDDYTRFPSVKETFVEVITLAAIRGSGDDSKLVVNNKYDPNGMAKFNNLPPLVLLDGMLVQKDTDLINYNVREIQSIRVIVQPYRYGSKIYSGIIAVVTKKGDFVPVLEKDYIEELNLAPVVKKKAYYRTDYSDKSSLSRIPDYRAQLLWEPKLRLSKEAYSTSFYTSDVAGVFEISLEGYSDGGEFITAKKFFEVVED